MTQYDSYDRYLCVSNIKRQKAISDKVKEFVNNNMIYKDLHRPEPIRFIKYNCDLCFNAIVRFYNAPRPAIRYIASIFFGYTMSVITIIDPYTCNIVAESNIPDVYVDYVLTKLKEDYIRISRIVVNCDTEKDIFTRNRKD